MGRIFPKPDPAPSSGGGGGLSPGDQAKLDLISVTAPANLDTFVIGLNGTKKIGAFTTPEYEAIPDPTDDTIYFVDPEPDD